MKFLIFVVFCFGIYFPESNAQNILDLGQILINSSPRYHFESFKDAREKESFDCKIVPYNSSKVQNFVLKNGLTSSFDNYNKSQNGDAIIVSIKSFDLFEKSMGSNIVEGNFWLSIEFFSIKETEIIPLTEYNYTSSYKRANQKQDDIKTIIKNGFSKSFAYFDGWFLKNNLKSEGLAKSVKVLSIRGTSNDLDTLDYDFRRKLNWTDFKGKKTEKSKYAATIFSSFGFNANAKVVKGEIIVTNSINTYMVPKMSWVAEGAKSDYALAHEQAHFDITFLISEEFKNELSVKTFSIVDWESEIRYLYLEYFMKLNKIQEKYDLETNHGLNENNQKDWLLKINSKLLNYKP